MISSLEHSRRQSDVRSMIARCEGALRQAGIPSARAEAEWLIAGVLEASPAHPGTGGVNRTTLYLWDAPLAPSQGETIERLLARRLRGEPLPYVVGWTDFFGLRFGVSPAVLIPRPETEVLVQRAVEHLRSCAARGHATVQVLDVGTGSGALAVTLAALVPACVVTALELSWDALQVARANAVTHHVVDRIRFIRTDWTRGVFVAHAAGGRPGGRFDLVVSNPPYVSADDVDNSWEPRMSLEGGADGMAFHRRLLRDAPGLLASSGMMGMECAEAQAASLCAAAAAQPWVRRAEVYRDLAQRPRGVWIDTWKF